MSDQATAGRREVLVAAGASVASTVGCLGRRPGASTATSTGSTPAAGPWGTPVEVGGGTLVLERPRVAKAIAEDAGIWQDLRCDDGQYLVVEATTGGSVPDRLGDLDLASVIGGEAVEDVALVVEGRPGDAPRAPSAWDRRTVAFSFPDGPLEGASVRWRGEGETARWPLGDGLRERLRVEPAFELRRFDVEPDGDDVRVDLSVENTGDRPGDFLAQVAFEAVEDDSSLVELSVPTDEVAEFRGVPPILRGIAREGLVVTLAYSGVDRVGRERREL